MENIIESFYLIFWKYFFQFASLIKLNLKVKTKYGFFLCRNLAEIIYTLPIYESELRKYFNIDNGVFIDVGANIGRYTIEVGKKLKNNGAVIAIEPNLETFQILKNNIKLNHLTNVYALNYACYSKSNKLVKFYEGSYSGESSLSKNKSRFFLVKTLTLDDILKKVHIKSEFVTLIKIDVEGSEVSVIRGSQKILKNKPTILFESFSEKKNPRISKLLKKFGYKINRIGISNYIAIAN